MANWTADLETIIYSVIKLNTYSALVDDFPNINYSAEETSTTKATFPNVYIHTSSASEQGADLQGESINAVMTVIQVDITANTTKSDAKKVAYTIVDALKGLRFEITSLPIFTKEDDVHRAIIRARRMIGSGDTL